MIAHVVARHNAADAAGPAPRRPNDVVVHRIGRSKPALAAGNRPPHAARNWACATTTASAAKAELEAIAGTTVGAAVLLVAKHVVGNLIVGGDVINLRDGQAYMVPRATMIY